MRPRYRIEVFVQSGLYFGWKNDKFVFIWGNLQLR